jgi:rhamnogalacturonyl hydrolase YesR
LAQVYGHDFSTPAYVPGMSLIARMALGEMDAVEALLQPYLAGAEFAVDNASVMAGQLVFAEYAQRTGNTAALQIALRAADLAFDEQGRMLEAAPFHNEMSDSLFMVPPLLVQAGKLSGETRYFDMAARHIAFMQDLLLREDGLYRHTPLADVAWSRGNAFPALGLALTLSDMPVSHPAYGAVRESYLQLLSTLLPYQDADGLWREVIDYPGAFAELTSTAMIGIAIKRGIDRGWLESSLYAPVLEKAWQAVLARTSVDGEFVDACTSTGKLDSLDAYLDRPAILGRDDRAGGMVMNFAIEMVVR